MLRPTKHSHPDRTVINVSLLLLARLKARRVDEYDVLHKFAKKSVVGGDVLFLPALNFLYLIEPPRLSWRPVGLSQAATVVT